MLCPSWAIRNRALSYCGLCSEVFSNTASPALASRHPPAALTNAVPDHYRLFLSPPLAALSVPCSG